MYVATFAAFGSESEETYLRYLQVLERCAYGGLWGAQCSSTSCVGCKSRRELEFGSCGSLDAGSAEGSVDSTDGSRGLEGSEYRALCARLAARCVGADGNGQQRERESPLGVEETTVSGRCNESSGAVGTCEYTVRGVVTADSHGAPGVAVPVVNRGKHYDKNKRRRVAAKLARLSAKRKGFGEFGGATKPSVDGSGGCVSDESVTGSVCTADTRTGVEIEAAQTLAACRVAENRKREVEARVAAKLAEHRLVALHDKDRTVAVQRLAAARYEQKINEAKAKSQASYKKCDESMKSLGSTGSAGEFALKQAVKEARDNAITLKYVQEQAEFLLQHVTPEIRQRVAEMPEPEYEDEFEVFGDCPSDYDEEQREAYYDDLNRRNANHGLVGSSPAPPRRELTPEEFLKIEEEIRALSANQV